MRVFALALFFPARLAVVEEEFDEATTGILTLVVLLPIVSVEDIFKLVASVLAECTTSPSTKNSMATSFNYYYPRILLYF